MRTRAAPFCLPHRVDEHLEIYHSHAHWQMLVVVRLPGIVEVDVRDLVASLPDEVRLPQLVVTSRVRVSSVETHRHLVISFPKQPLEVADIEEGGP